MFRAISCLLYITLRLDQLHVTYESEQNSSFVILCRLLKMASAPSFAIQLFLPTYDCIMHITEVNK
jgi:hypothetical protein